MPPPDEFDYVANCKCVHINRMKINTTIIIASMDYTDFLRVAIDKFKFILNWALHVKKNI